VCFLSFSCCATTPTNLRFALSVVGLLETQKTCKYAKKMLPVQAAALHTFGPKKGTEISNRHNLARRSLKRHSILIKTYSNKNLGMPILTKTARSYIARPAKQRPGLQIFSNWAKVRPHAFLSPALPHQVVVPHSFPRMIRQYWPPMIRCRRSQSSLRLTAFGCGIGD
jgi:hypothetical protein